VIALPKWQAQQRLLMDKSRPLQSNMFVDSEE